MLIESIDLLNHRTRRTGGSESPDSNSFTGMGLPHHLRRRWLDFLFLATSPPRHLYVVAQVLLTSMLRLVPATWTVRSVSKPMAVVPRLCLDCFMLGAPPAVPIAQVWVWAFCLASSSPYWGWGPLAWAARRTPREFPRARPRGSGLSVSAF